MLTCPQCNKKLNVVCSNLDCVCWKRTKPDELPMKDWGWLLFGKRIPLWIGNVLYNILCKMKICNCGLAWRMMAA